VRATLDFTMTSVNPPNPKHIKEATLAGLKLLRRAGKQFPNDNIYECPTCANELRIRAETVRANVTAKNNSSWGCEYCKWEEYISEADAVGLEVISKVDDTHKLFYRFKACSHEQEISKQSVRLGQFNCRTCLENKLQNEAAKVSLEIVGKSSNLNYRLYRHKQCGHTGEYVTSHVRLASSKVKTHPYRCKSCITLELQNEAKQAGLTLYGESHTSGKNKWYLYKAPCSHTLVRRSDQVRLGDWKCDACIETKLNDEAAKVGLELVGKGKDKAHRQYQFRSCGHVREITTANVRSNTFHCDKCFWEDKSQVLEQRGLTLLGKVDVRDKYLFKIIQCGHIREISLSNAIDGSYVCHECEDTWYTSPSNVYLLRMTLADHCWLKLGVAKVIKTRIKQYGLPSATVVEPLFVLPTDTGKQALSIESQLNKEFGQFRYLPDQMKRWHRYSGFTECYPVSILPKIEKSLRVFNAN